MFLYTLKGLSVIQPAVISLAIHKMITAASDMLFLGALGLDESTLDRKHENKILRNIEDLSSLMIESMNRIDKQTGKKIQFVDLSPVSEAINKISTVKNKKVKSSLKSFVLNTIEKIDKTALKAVIEKKSEGANPLLSAILQVGKMDKISGINPERVFFDSEEGAFLKWGYDQYSDSIERDQFHVKQTKLKMLLLFIRKILERVNRIESVAPLTDVLGMLGQSESDAYLKRQALAGIAQMILKKMRVVKNPAPLTFALKGLYNTSESDTSQIKMLQNFINETIEKIEHLDEVHPLVDTLYWLGKVNQTNRRKALFSIAQEMILKGFFPEEKIKKVLSQFIKDDSLKSRLLKTLEIRKTKYIKTGAYYKIPKQISIRSRLSLAIRRLHTVLTNITKSLIRHL